MTSTLLRRALRATLVASGVLALCAPAHAAQAPAQPNVAMWKLESGGSKIYFLGSIHVLPQNTEWKNAVIEKAMAESDIFYFETVLGDGGGRQMSTILNRDTLLPKGKTLSAMLSAKGREELKTINTELGLNPKVVDRLRPWAAMMLLSGVAGRDEAVGPGVDPQVASVSLTNRKHRRYFAMPLQHAAVLGRLDEGGPQLFEQALRDIRSTRKSFRELVNAWLAGDADKVVSLGTSGLDRNKVTKRVLLDERNREWVKQIPFMLREKRTFFVTVGAAHLAGDDSVVDLLCRQGLALQRIHTAGGKTEPACPKNDRRIANAE